MLDEADEMLSMGFQENVEEILSYIPVGKEYQMLLWSATVPAWVKKLSHKSVLFYVVIVLTLPQGCVAGEVDATTESHMFEFDFQVHE